MFKIYNEQESQNEVFLKLSQEGSEIVLMAVDKSGNRLSQGNLLRITDDGFIRRIECVNDALGFQLNGSGQVKIEGE